MALRQCSDEMLPALEQELKRQVARFDRPDTEAFYDMLTYHMGWTGNAAGASAMGKRIRPLLLLLVVAACGEQWLHAVSPAAAIEIVHNFSLIHDDIEDNSPTRRGRLTLWKKFGIPMAINAGDALFALSNRAVLDAAAHYSAERVLKAAASLHQACVELTRGQFLDMFYEKRLDISVNEYWPMIAAKTAALLSAAAEMGAILGGTNERTTHDYAEFARQLGLAFQIRDDILGVWGDESTTGKSAASDLVEGKNSLPILYGIGRKAEFARRWAAGPIGTNETPALAQLLKDEGAYDFALQEAARLTDMAMASLQAAAPAGDAGQALAELAAQLLQRRL